MHTGAPSAYGLYLIGRQVSGMGRQCPEQTLSKRVSLLYSSRLRVDV